ncbi:SND2/TMEM208 family protein (plasmid) [Coraliomargarita sp. W4R53]
MKSWIVRFGALYVYNVIVLLVIGVFSPAKVGFHAFWAAIIMVIAEALVKPLVLKLFAQSAAKSAGERTKTAESLVQAGIVFAVAEIVWILTIVLSGVGIGGSWFWVWIVPPLIITLGWWIYSRVNKKLEAQASDIYDRTLGRGTPTAGASAEPSTLTTSAVDLDAAHKELHDGLTAEQRKMLDDLGRS